MHQPQLRAVRHTSKANQIRSGRIRAMRPVPQQRLDRRAALGRLLPLWPHELADESPQGRLRVVARLRKALRAERRRGLAGHWTYDLARHVELLRLYRAEAAALSETSGQAPAVFANGDNRPAKIS
jgi:hypothetical protein